MTVPVEADAAARIERLVGRIIAHGEGGADKLVIHLTEDVARLPALVFQATLEGERLVHAVAQGCGGPGIADGIAAETAAAGAVALGKAVDQEIPLGAGERGLQKAHGEARADV